MCQIISKEGSEKKGIVVSEGSDMCNHTRKLELMSDSKVEVCHHPICSFLEH